MSLFGIVGKKGSKPSDMVKHTRESLATLEKTGSSSKHLEKATDDLSKSLAGMKITMAGDVGHDPNPDHSGALANEIYTSNLLQLLVQHLPKLEFEARKDLVTVWNHLLRRQIGSQQPTVDYILKNPSILDHMCKGYETIEVAVNCGQMLRDACRYESLCNYLLKSDNVWKFFKYVEVSSFDVASDAFSTFKEILTKHKGEVAQFLETNYDKFFSQYTRLLTSGNYATRRQSLKLLSELLLDRANFNIMNKYIADQNNLKMIMNFLRDKKKSIQFEAFHVFKVFVANPAKPEQILTILLKNQEKLIAFLQKFQNEKEDEQFADEKSFLIKQVQALTPK